MENFPQRVYNMPDADLAQFTTNLCSYLTRDTSDLAKFGIDSTKIAVLQALQNAFEVYPTDVQLNYISMQKTEAKDAQRELIVQMVADVRVRAAVVFGVNGGFYKEFGFTDVTKLSDNSFLSGSRMIAATAEKYLTQLADKGQTQTEIDDMRDACDAFEILLQEKAAADSNRTESARIRINKGNELYGFVGEYCDFGRTFYANTDPAKYQDYVIYSVGQAVAVHGAPSGLHFTDETTLAWTAIDNATSYGISVSSDGGSNWQADISTPTNSSSVPTVSVGKLYYKVRGHNSTGYGEYSGTFEKLFGLSTVENFFYSDNQFTWNPVEFANGYDIQYSLSGEENWVLVFNGNATDFSHTPASGSWTYRIRASYGSIKSEWVELAVEGV